MELLKTPVYRSILTPPLTLGLPNNVFLFILVSGLATIVSMGQWWFIVAIAVFVIVGNAITRQDVFAFDIILRLVKLPEAMD